MKSPATCAKEMARSKNKVKQIKKATPKPTPKQPRPTKYPWEVIESFFVHGEESTGANGAPIRTQPAISEVAHKFDVPVSTLSQRANTRDASGQTWYDKRNEYLREFKAHRDTRIAEQIVDQEVAFRNTTLSTAQMIVQHVAIQLHRGLRRDMESNPRSLLDPDSLSKLAASARKGQEIGLVAMERNPDGDQNSQGVDDWTLMRRVRAEGLVQVTGRAHE